MTQSKKDFIKIPFFLAQAAAASMDWTVALQRHSAAQAASQQMSFAAAATAHHAGHHHPGFAAHAAAGMYGWY